MLVSRYGVAAICGLWSVGRLMVKLARKKKRRVIVENIVVNASCCNVLGIQSLRCGNA